jgi:hypothetical protein
VRIKIIQAFNILPLCPNYTDFPKNAILLSQAQELFLVLALILTCKKKDNINIHHLFSNLAISYIVVATGLGWCADRLKFAGAAESCDYIPIYQICANARYIESTLTESNAS